MGSAVTKADNRAGEKCFSIISRMGAEERATHTLIGKEMVCVRAEF